MLLALPSSPVAGAGASLRDLEAGETTPEWTPLTKKLEAASPAPGSPGGTMK